ncbi:Hsp70 family protein [Nocardia alni]|uniref:Hsp70 family protein n=1 Tax=Nocardia alni TaxID=2815723 RepID=UPI001C236E64|nr:Hsp70 family protein [Nocardia alni]
MSSVLGISVGAGAIRVARPHAGNSAEHFAADHFDLQTTAVGEQRVEDVVGDAIGAALTPDVAATTIAYRNDSHAHAVRAALARRQITNYELVPEASAAVEFLQACGELRGKTTIALYDLGSAGLSVSVVDVATRKVHYSERTSDIGGDYLDLLIREQQIASGRIAHPSDPQGLAVLDQLCRSAKEQLTTSTAVALPSEYGLVLLTQENLDALIMLGIESSARMTRDVIMRSERAVQAVVAIGGCARIPLVATVTERWIGVPVVVPAQPETVVARGAALLARPSRSNAPTPVSLDAKTEVLPTIQPDGSVARRRRRRASAGVRSRLGAGGKSGGRHSRRSSDALEPAEAGGRELAFGSRRELSVAGVAVGALVVVAALGLALGWGPQVLQGDSQSTKATPTTAPRTVSSPVVPVPTLTTPPVDSTNASVPAPPPYQRHTVAKPSAPQGPNTIVVVPGLPGIVVPTLPPLLPGFPAR